MSDKTEPGKKPGVQKPAGQQNVCPRPVPRWLAWPVCVPKCAPKRRSCALKNANRAICVLMFAHLSFRRAHRNANRPYLLLLRCCAVTPLCRHAVAAVRGTPKDAKRACGKSCHRPVSQCRTTPAKSVICENPRKSAVGGALVGVAPRQRRHAVGDGNRHLYDRRVAEVMLLHQNTAAGGSWVCPQPDGFQCCRLPVGFGKTVSLL